MLSVALVGALILADVLVGTVLVFIIHSSDMPLWPGDTRWRERIERRYGAKKALRFDPCGLTE